MILRLNRDYQLRGWKGAACAIMHRKTRQVDFVKPALFHLLLLCNGAAEIDGSRLSQAERDYAQELIKRGVISTLDEKSRIEPDQEYMLYPNRYVRSLQWSVTGRCNFKCRHCYMDAGSGQLGEISHEAAMSIIDQMDGCGIGEVLLTGGEPFVRSDIWDIIGRLTEKGIRIDQIYTNGWLVNEKVLDRLSELGQKPEFSMSLDCIGWHDWMRGVKGAEERVLNAIRLCNEKGFTASVETCVHRGSLASLRDTIRLMGEMNVRIKVGSVMNTEQWKKMGEGYGLSDEEYFEAMLRQIEWFFEDGMPADLKLGSVISLRKGSTDFKVIAEKFDGSEKCGERPVCGAARMNAYITPDARLLPCMPMLSWDGYTRFKSILETGLQEGLTDSFYMSFLTTKVKNLFEKNSGCGSCEYRLRCGGGCRACAMVDTGDMYGCDPGQCFFWKNGYVDRIRKTAEDAIRKFNR